MAELLSAGVFTEEVASGESVVLGASTSNYATVGWLPRGPEDKATLVTSLPDYQRKFGGYWKNSDVPLAITAFFKNGGSRAYVVGVRPTDAVAATGTIPGRWNITAFSRGLWGNLARLVLKGNQNNYDFATATYSKFDVEIQEETVDGLGDYVAVETFEAVDLSDADSPDYFPLVLNDEQNGSKEAIIAQGVSGGIPDAFAPVTWTAEAFGTGNGTITSFTHTAAHPKVAVFTAKLKVNGVLVATDNGRGKWTAVTGTSYTVGGTLNYTTGALAVTLTPAVPSAQPIVVDYIQAGVASIAYDLSGGADGTAVDQNQVTSVALAANSKGLYALDLVDEILNIGLPDFRGNAGVANDLLDYCDNRQDAFAILDTKKGIDAQDAKNYKQVTLASLSSWGAIYWPGVKVKDPILNNKVRAMSPVGHIAGRYAFTDQKRNVGKAPAGTVDGALSFCEGLEIVVKQGDRDLVYPVGVNPLIDTPATGRAIWGARTLQVSGDFNLINIRRLFIFLRKSTYLSTQDLVFEPVGEDLFNTTTLRMVPFLTRLTGEGYFISRVPKEAFRFVCDTTNNTDATIAARQLVSDVFVAGQSPAEFVRFRFHRALNKLS